MQIEAQLKAMGLFIRSKSEYGNLSINFGYPLEIGGIELDGH